MEGKRSVCLKGGREHVWYKSEKRVDLKELDLKRTGEDN